MRTSLGKQLTTWPKFEGILYKAWPEKILDDLMWRYGRVRKELSIEDRCILYGARVVVPLKLQTLILKEIH